MTKYIAIYLPQFHPIPENNKWYGEGFTEWTNVARAKTLFKNHYQPHVPADLGFYDLRLKETRHEQAKMAKKYGIEAFCYWHYWFGNGKRILEMPFNEVVKDKSIDFPFCLAWANDSWKKKCGITNKKDTLLLEQTYPGDDDFKQHFYAMLDAFRDPRYFRVEGKLFFAIYHPLDVIGVDRMIKIWNQLGREEGIGEFFFVGGDFACRDKKKILDLGFNCIYDDNVMNIHHNLSYLNKIRLYIQRNIFHMPTIFKYKEAIKHMIIKEDYANDVIPMVAPNWDHSPRSGRKSMILHDCKPIYFNQLLDQVEKAMENKDEERKIVLIRAWNEWGEGNHLEPDLKYGKGYLEAIQNHTKNKKG